MLAGYTKLLAVAALPDAALIDPATGGVLAGRGGVAVSASEVEWISARLPDDLPTDIGLVTAWPLMAEASQCVEDYFANYPPLRARAQGLRADLLCIDYVTIPTTIEHSDERLLYCALEHADLLVTDHHRPHRRSRLSSYGTVHPPKV